jgi:hypothetical protein
MPPQRIRTLDDLVIRAVAFDVGETLVDETRLWGELADAAGVTRRTFSAHWER